MTLAAFFTLFSVCLLGVIAPGPSLAMVIRHALSGGRRNGLATAWAHAGGVLTYAIITSCGLAALLQHSPIIFKTITYIGAAYLAYLGVRSLMSKGGLQAQISAGKRSSLWKAAGDGLAISLLNPKIALFFIALFSQFIAIAENVSQTIVVVAMPAILDALWYSIIAVIISSPAVMSRIQAKTQILDKLTGGILLVIAAKVVIG